MRPLDAVIRVWEEPDGQVNVLLTDKNRQFLASTLLTAEGKITNVEHLFGFVYSQWQRSPES